MIYFKLNIQKKIFIEKRCKNGDKIERNIERKHQKRVITVNRKLDQQIKHVEIENDDIKEPKYSKPCYYCYSRDHTTNCHQCQICGELGHHELESVNYMWTEKVLVQKKFKNYKSSDIKSIGSDCTNLIMSFVGNDPIHLRCKLCKKVFYGKPPEKHIIICMKKIKSGE